MEINDPAVRHKGERILIESSTGFSLWSLLRPTILYLPPRYAKSPCSFTVSVPVKIEC